VPPGSRPDLSKILPNVTTAYCGKLYAQARAVFGFIYAYTRVLGRPPAEADMQRHLGVSPPSVHQMVLNLERTGLVRRQHGVARSRSAGCSGVAPGPTLTPSQGIKTAVPRH